MATTPLPAPTYAEPVERGPDGRWHFNVKWLDWFLHLQQTPGGGGGGGGFMTAPVSPGIVVSPGGVGTLGRTLQAGNPTVTITNGDGIAGNPTITVKSIAVGGIYVTVDPTNPATSLGYGTWTMFGQGRVLVGLDPTNPNFHLPEQTGGSYI